MAAENYDVNTHIPYASGHTPNVCTVQNSRVVDTAEGSGPPSYRISRPIHDDLASLRAGIDSEDDRATIADLPTSPPAAPRGSLSKTTDQSP